MPSGERLAKQKDKAKERKQRVLQVPPPTRHSTGSSAMQRYVDFERNYKETARGFTYEYSTIYSLAQRNIESTSSSLRHVNSASSINQAEDLPDDIVPPLDLQSRRSEYSTLRAYTPSSSKEQRTYEIFSTANSKRRTMRCVLPHDKTGEGFSLPAPVDSVTRTSQTYSVSNHSTDTKLSSIRFINSAAYIEKTPSSSEAGDITDVSVPSLDLHSVCSENFPASHGYMSSNRKRIEVAKVVLKPDQSYQHWLNGKKKQRAEMAARQKQIEDQKRQKEEQRLKISNEIFKKWLAEKQKGSRDPQPQSDDKSQKGNGQQLCPNERKEKIEEWHRKKEMEESKQQKLKQMKAEDKRKKEEERRLEVAKATKRWMAQVTTKPKPVPLNEGISTLRGTISDIWINPNEWQNP